ncbi:cathelicidin-5-like [Phyllostomus hastatus]|uniref:cathelicidin-5-like n=1 Tax=Phyllostomus hastatus TaxID=9423 RepID=UPI001E68443E|nr:cathelicidin-5-like [Phyllostomus hastatus]
METQKDNLPWGRWSLLLLLLGLAVPPATAQVLSYNEAVLAAVVRFNQRSSEANLYRLLELGPQRPDGDDNPSTPKPVNFTLKETVCPRMTQLPPEQCEFKENGLVKQCAGTVTLDQANGYFDINCVEPVECGVLKAGGQTAKSEFGGALDTGEEADWVLGRAWSPEEVQSGGCGCT